MTTLQHARRAGTGTPTTSDEAPAGGAARGFSEQARWVSLDCAERTAVEQADKAFATLRARMALAGFQLSIVTGDGCGSAYMLSRGNLHRTLNDVAAVEAFADRVGAPA